MLNCIIFYNSSKIYLQFRRFPDSSELLVKFKDVRANCLCASLLRTQLMSQRYATSCTSARAKEEIYSPKGMVSVALTLLRINSLGWSVSPTFFWIETDFFKIRVAFQISYLRNEIGDPPIFFLHFRQK